MSVVVITGSAGLIGSEAAAFFAGLGLDVVGIDNDSRSAFFGPDASTRWNVVRMTRELGAGYQHHEVDVRDREALLGIFRRFGSSITLVIHAAAQPSHDWAARDPFTDFDINASGTLNVLEATRQYCPDATFIFTSTNKVYGDTPNELPFVELESRYELHHAHRYWDGIPEEMSIDGSTHSVFGASKVAADVMVQEYGRYFGMMTTCFRGGTLTGPHHAAAELHGFLAYVMKCALTRTPYRVIGYKGKQVRDAIHSRDLIGAFHEVFKNPGAGKAYNIGGGRFSNCSVLEAIDQCERISGIELAWSYEEQHRIGDHIWWIGSNARFEREYPDWRLTYDVPAILQEIKDVSEERWQPT